VALVQNLSADIFGNHVNIASRIEALAKGGQIFLSRTVYDSAHSWVRSEFIKYKYHGKAKLKGIEGKEDIYQVGMEGDDFSGVESIKRSKRMNIIKLSLTGVLVILATITVSYLLLQRQKAEFWKPKYRILFEVWSSDYHHSTLVPEDLQEGWGGKAYKSRNIYHDPRVKDYSHKKAFMEVLDTTKIKTLDDSTIKKMYFDFKMAINKKYDEQEIARRFVFEDEMVEKGFVDTFDIGDDIPLPILQSIGCDGYLACEIFRSPSSDTLYCYYEFVPHKINKPLSAEAYILTSLDVDHIIQSIFEQIDEVGRWYCPIGKIVSIDDDICYIENKFKVPPKFVGKYLTLITRDTITVIDGIRCDIIYLPYILEVKSISKSSVTANILKESSPNLIDSVSTLIVANLPLRKGDYVWIIMKDVYSHDFYEISSIWNAFTAAYGRSLIAQGKFKKALKIYGDKYRKMDEKNLTERTSVHLYLYARDWARTGKNLKSALKAAKKSLELKETDYAWDTLSLVYWKMGKYQEALEAEEKALQLAGGKDKDYEKRIADIKADMEKKGKR
jgi:tetratricopeptide (TPR) repeat protein